MVLGCRCGVELVVCVSVVRVGVCVRRCWWCFGVFWVDVAPAGCVHACSKWQTSGFPPLREGNLKEGGQIINFACAIDIVPHSRQGNLALLCTLQTRQQVVHFGSVLFLVCPVVVGEAAENVFN